MPDVPVLDKDKAKKLINNIKNKNSSKLKDFSVKEIVIIFHGQTQKQISKLDEKIDKHIKWGETEDKNLTKALADHDKLFQKITNLLPEKGFCQKVTDILELDKKITLSDKVELLWHDRRWVKAILATLITLIGVISINIYVTVT